MSEPQAWHGLSHKQAWGDLGSSYADLHERQARHAVADARTVSSDVVVKMQQPAAGVESAARPKGAGTFQLQSGWGLAQSEIGQNSYTTELSEQYKVPPNGSKPAESQAQQGKLSTFPKGTYPSDFKTTKQIDFAAACLADCRKPLKAHRQPDSGIMLGTSESMDAAKPDCQSAGHPQTTQARSPLLDGSARDTAGITVPSYNIITGDRPLHNDRAKYCSGQQMDYRRRR